MIPNHPILKSLEEYFDYSPELKLAQLDVEMHEINVKLPELPVQIWRKIEAHSTYPLCQIIILID